MPEKSARRSEGCPSYPAIGLGKTSQSWGLSPGMHVRVRWSQAGLALLGVAGVLLALRIGPSLLKPPAPAPLPADVGLPRVEARSGPVVSEPREDTGSGRGSDPGIKRRLGRVVSGGGARRRAEASEGETSKQKPHRPVARRSAQHKPSTPTRRQDPPAVRSVPEPVPPPEYVPPPPPKPPPEPAPTPPPPDDGSMEFAPH